MGDEITRYELDVLRWHKDRLRKKSDNADRKDSQIWLAMAGYPTQVEEGRFSITTKGPRLLTSRH
jgi:hypothetical protein